MPWYNCIVCQAYIPSSFMATIQNGSVLSNILIRKTSLTKTWFPWEQLALMFSFDIFSATIDYTSL